MHFQKSQGYLKTKVFDKLSQNDYKKQIPQNLKINSSDCDSNK